MNHLRVLKARPEERSSWEHHAGDHCASFSYYEPRFRLQAIKIHPGEYYVTHEDILLVTVLGSCVSACIRDPEVHVGGMNHFMLPEADPGGPASRSARYGSYAMELLINELLKRGASRSRLEAKVFGGANVLRTLNTNSVGQRNVDFVLEYLQAERIPIVAQDLLHMHARRLNFFPRSGRALVATPGVRSISADLADERAYGRRLRVEPASGDVELFD